MLGIARRNTNWSLALDIGSDGIKLLQLQPDGDHVAVRAAAQWRFPADTTTPERRREETISAVRQMRQSGRFRGRRVNSTLPCGHVAVKNVRLPRATPREMAKAVRWEAEERFGFDVQPDRLSYLEAGEVRAGTDVRQEIIMLAVPAEAVDSHVSLLSEMGLSPEHIGVAPIAAFHVHERFLRRQADEQTVSVVIDLGRSGTRVVVARGRQIVFIKNIDIGGQALNDAVAAQLGISNEEAGDLRRRTMTYEAGPAGQVGPDEAGAPKHDAVSWTVHDAIRSEAEALGKEIALCLRYCSVTFRGLRPARAILTGGEAYDPALVAILKEQLSVECIVGCPLKDIDTSAMSCGPDRRASLTEWSVCVGLALSSMAEVEGRSRQHARHRLPA